MSAQSDSVHPDAGFIEELNVEAGEVDLRLLAGRANRTSKPGLRGGRISRRVSVIAV